MKEEEPAGVAKAVGIELFKGFFTTRNKKDEEAEKLCLEASRDKQKQPDPAATKAKKLLEPHQQLSFVRSSASK